MAYTPPSSPGDLSALNGNFKTVYGDKIVQIVPEAAILQKRISFASADKQPGSYFEVPILMSDEGGFSYLGSTGAVQSLNAAVSMSLPSAQVKGTEVILQSWLSYTAASRAASSAGAFKKSTGVLVENMNRSARKRLEISMLYGQSSIGKVSSVNSRTITITDATWAPGIWAGMEGHWVQFFDDTAATANEDGAAGYISAVDFVNKTITIGGATSVTGIDSNSYIYLNGARTTTAHNDMAGLQAIFQNSGTLHNISAATYGLWAGSNKTSLGQPTFAKLQDALMLPVSKGLNSKVLILIPPKAFGALNADQSALRVYDSSYKSGKAENGFEALSFHSANGLAEIVVHPYVKEGDCFIVPLEETMRIGSVDLSFTVPGMSEQFFQLRADKNAYVLQCMADQAIFVERPGHGGYVSGLIYA